MNAVSSQTLTTPHAAATLLLGLLSIARRQVAPIIGEICCGKVHRSISEIGYSRTIGGIVACAMLAFSFSIYGCYVLCAARIGRPTSRFR